MPAHRFAVLGGGLSGLAAAWNLARSGREVDVILLESSKQVGGWVRSEKTAEGAVFELGPRSLRTAGAVGKHSLRLVSELGLSSDILPVLPSHRGAGRRFIFTNHHGLVTVPSDLSWLVKTKPPFSSPLLMTILKEVFKRSEAGDEDESIYSFVSRRLGKELADYLIDPLCRGVFAGNAHHLSLKSCFPLLHQYEKQHGSLIRGALMTKKDPLPLDMPPLVQQAIKEKWQTYTLREGLESLPKAMHKALVDSGVRVFTGQPCTKLTFAGSTAKIETVDSVYDVEHVVSALPSHALAGLLSDDHHPLSEQLHSIPSVTVGVVCLEYTGEVIPTEYREAFGYLVPSHQTSKALGVVFDSSTFPQQNRRDSPSTRMTVMLGGHWFEGLFGSPETVDSNTVTQAALETLEDHLGIRKQPSHVITRIHKACIPQYTLGHSSRVESIFNYITEKKLPLSLVGASFRGVSVNDCMYNAVQATNTLLQ